MHAKLVSKIEGVDGPSLSTYRFIFFFLYTIRILPLEYIGSSKLSISCGMKIAIRLRKVYLFLLFFKFPFFFGL